MDDSEKTSDSMLLEEAMAETEKSSQEGSVIAGDGTEDSSQDVGDDSLGMVQDALGENEDVEMADGVAEDSENNNLAPEDSMDAPGTILEGEDGSQGNLSNSDAFLGDQFISQTDSLIIQNEPPQQLMEEADLPGDGEAEQGMIGEGDIADDEGIVTEAKSAIEPSHQTGDEEEMLLHQEGENEPHDESGNVNLGTLPEGIALGVVSDQMEGEEDAGADLDGDGLQKAEGGMVGGEDDHGEDSMVLRLEESETENGTADGAESLALLAGGDPLEGALSELEGKISATADGNAQLTGQESLQGIQLMEGDDKPEEEEDDDDDDVTLQGEAAQQEIQAQLSAALLKQEEMKTEEEDHPESDTFPEGQQNSAESDALSTLASAALDHQAPTNGVKSELDETQIKTENDNQEPQWMDVGICKGTHCQVRSYYIPRPGQSWDQNWEGITTSTLPDHRALAKLELESGKAYKFRVAAINSCGRGPWSEVAAFKTSLPGFPGAPSAIKIAKTSDGAHLSWEPPPIASGVIEDYHVYLAVRTATTDTRVVSSGTNQLAFVRIYQGAANQCTVGNDTLSKAHIDTTTKPAILFRISARNEKGIGPATQVRWLQEVGTPNNAARPAQAPRRPAESKPHGNYKRKKSE